MFVVWPKQPTGQAIALTGVEFVKCQETPQFAWHRGDRVGSRRQGGLGMHRPGLRTAGAQAAGVETQISFLKPDD